MNPADHVELSPQPEEHEHFESERRTEDATKVADDAEFLALLVANNDQEDSTFDELSPQLTDDGELFGDEKSPYGNDDDSKNFGSGSAFLAMLAAEEVQETTINVDDGFDAIDCRPGADPDVKEKSSSCFTAPMTRLALEACNPRFKSLAPEQASAFATKGTVEKMEQDKPSYEEEMKDLSNLLRRMLEEQVEAKEALLKAANAQTESAVRIATLETSLELSFKANEELQQCVDIAHRQPIESAKIASLEAKLEFCNLENEELKKALMAAQADAPSAHTNSPHDPQQLILQLQHAIALLVEEKGTLESEVEASRGKLRRAAHAQAKIEYLVNENACLMEKLREREQCTDEPQKEKKIKEVLPKQNHMTEPTTEARVKFIFDDNVGLKTHARHLEGMTGALQEALRASELALNKSRSECADILGMLNNKQEAAEELEMQIKELQQLRREDQKELEEAKEIILALQAQAKHRRTDHLQGRIEYLVNENACLLERVRELELFVSESQQEIKKDEPITGPSVKFVSDDNEALKTHVGHLEGLIEALQEALKATETALSESLSERDDFFEILDNKQESVESLQMQMEEFQQVHYKNQVELQDAKERVIALQEQLQQESLGKMEQDPSLLEEGVKISHVEEHESKETEVTKPKVTLRVPMKQRVQKQEICTRGRPSNKQEAESEINSLRRQLEALQRQQEETLHQVQLLEQQRKHDKATIKTQAEHIKQEKQLCEAMVVAQNASKENLLEACRVLDALQKDLEESKKAEAGLKQVVLEKDQVLADTLQRLRDLEKSKQEEVEVLRCDLEKTKTAEAKLKHALQEMEGAKNEEALLSRAMEALRNDLNASREAESLLRDALQEKDQVLANTSKRLHDLEGSKQEEVQMLRKALEKSKEVEAQLNLALHEKKQHLLEDTLPRLDGPTAGNPQIDVGMAASAASCTCKSRFKALRADLQAMWSSGSEVFQLPEGVMKTKKLQQMQAFNNRSSLLRNRHAWNRAIVDALILHHM